MPPSETRPWSVPLKLHDVGRAPVARRIVADEAARGRIAAELGLDRLDRLDAELEVAPWLDGAQLSARWSAAIEQTCGVTLEPFGSELEGEFQVKLLPRSSRHAPAENPEVAIDPEAEDPPDLLDEDVIDLGAYVVEHLAVEIDPFPRKPGAVFEPPPPEEPPSPFAVLKGLGAKPGS